MKKVERFKTSNGEYTLYLPDMDETYHSRHGAISESLHVFIEQGLIRLSQREALNILEIGFGTGLNALLTALHPNPQQQQRFYTTLEPYPIAEGILETLGYADFIEDARAEGLNQTIQAADWEKEVPIDSSFHLFKTKQKLEDYQADDESFDLVYFDAFAPKKQAELWEGAIFKKLYRLMRPQAVLTTYSAAGQLKRDLKAAGFTIENPPGANGKRQMTVALKP